MFRLSSIFLVCLLWLQGAAQELPKPPAQAQAPAAAPRDMPAQAQAPAAAPRDMKVRITYLNVCNPSDAEKQEIAAALQRIPAKARFGPEFEVSRGRSTMPDAPLANWVRVRREFPPDVPLSNAQYSISVDEKSIIETVVFRWRDPKDLLQVSIEDNVLAGAGPAAVLATDTPASRIRIERFGKASLGLARCAQADQTAYDPVFAGASAILTRYRQALGVRHTVPGELAKLGLGSTQPVSAKKTGAAKPAAGKPRKE